MLKKSLIGTAGICLTLHFLNSQSPHEYSFEKEIIINQSKSFVFGYLKFFRNNNTWSSFLSKDPNVITDIEGTDGFVGTVFYWSGNSNVGAAEQEIKKIIEGEKIELETRFLIPFKATHQALLITEEVSKTQTRVKWSVSGSVPFPINLIAKFKGLNQSIPTDMEAGLTKLKTQLESMIAIPELKL